MAKTALVAASLWVYLVLSHVALFSASSIQTDNISQIPLPWQAPGPNISWDYLLLAVQWPQSFCYDVVDMKYTNSCVVPSDVNQWTVHGLWPSKFSGEDVFNCNTSYPFDVSQVEDILPELKKHWPDTLQPNSTKLWAHEWNKHGSCAGIVPKLDGEHNYFQTTMGLLEQFSFDSMFQSQKLEPSDTQIYKADNFTQAVKKAIGQVPIINCYTTSHQKVQTTYILQVSICIDKTFQPIACPTNAPHFIQGNCGKRDLIYPTITHHK